MKAELPVSSQVAPHTLHVVATSGAARGEQGETTKSAQTRRPVAAPAPSVETQSRPKADQPEATDSSSASTHLQFSVDEGSGKMIVSIVDRVTSEVLRQIPAEEVLAVARQIEDRLRDDGNAQGFFVADQV